MVEKNLALLVEELRQDGVEKGRAEGARIIEEARHEAERILARARHEADEEIARSEREAASIKRMAHSAAEQAGVNLVASLRQSVDMLLRDTLGGIVREALADEELLAQMLISFASGLRPGEHARITISDAVDLERLTRVVFAKIGGELAEGLDISSTADFQGIRVRMHGDSVQYELSEPLLVEMVGPFLSERARSLLFP